MKIGLIGDSLTNGRPGVSFVMLLQEKYPNITLDNLGKPGETVKSLHDRLAKEPLHRDYELIFLWIGVNDVYSKLLKVQAQPVFLGVHAYLRLNGNAKEAVKFYEDVLKAEVLTAQTYGDLPENPEFPTPEEMKNLVIHAQLKVGDTYLMLSDAIPGQPYQLGTQVDVSITFNDVEESKEVFNKLKEGGEVIIPIAETAWSPSYGQLIDKYGIKWQFSTILE